MKRGIAFICIFCVFLIYRFVADSSYDTIDNALKLDDIRSKLEPNQELIVLKSKNPFNLYDLLNNIDNISEQNVYGILTSPKKPKKDNMPLIIGVAGSYGWKDHHYGYMDRYLDDGFATFTLHSFDSRNVEATVGEQLSATVAMVVHDAYMALDYLSKRSNIDGNNIGITGWSLGGGVSFFSAWQPIIDKLSPDINFAAHLPIYPPCMVKPDKMQFSSSPMHILIGELDDWVPAEPCNEIVAELKELGHNIDITVYPESHHGYDRQGDEVFIEHAYSFKDCSLSLNNDGVVVSNNINFPLFSPVMQKIGLFFCAERGSTIGGNDVARKASEIFALEFMNLHLNN